MASSHKLKRIETDIACPNCGWKVKSFIEGTFSVRCLDCRTCISVGPIQRKPK